MASENDPVKNPTDDKTSNASSVNTTETELVASGVIKKENTREDDPDLDDLLDSALADFDKQPLQPDPVKTSQADGPACATGVMDGQTLGQSDGSARQETLFADVFNGESGDEGAREFEEAMRQFMEQDPNMMAQFDRMTQGAGQPGGDASQQQQQFTDTLAQALSGMAQNAEGLKEPLSEDDMMRAFSGMGLDGEGQGQGEGDFMPMMQGMMRSLLSKEILYPSLKEISEKYPQWLEDNKEKTEASEYENYEKQYSLMKHICVQFEADDPTDSDSTKQERFEKILDLMQRMQELGHPPKEIVGEMAPGLEFDESGLPKLPSPEQCCVM